MFLFVSPLYTFCVLGKRDPFFCTFQLNSIAYKKKNLCFQICHFSKCNFIRDKTPLFFGNLVVYVEKWQFV